MDRRIQFSERTQVITRRHKPSCLPPDQSRFLALPVGRFRTRFHVDRIKTSGNDLYPLNGLRDLPPRVQRTNFYDYVNFGTGTKRRTSAVPKQNRGIPW